MSNELTTISQLESDSERALAAFQNKQEQELYAALGRYTLGVALEKGSLDERQAKAVEELLNGRMERIS